MNRTPIMEICLETPIVESARVAQVRGLFDLPRRPLSKRSWSIDLPLYQKPWNVGLVVGPSGCGKSTLARQCWPGALDHAAVLSRFGGGSVVDAFPEGMPIAEIVVLLSAVGFASPPQWLLPFSALSTGQQFRAGLALLVAMAAPGRLILSDEFTSAVDRTVARIGAHAMAKAVRMRRLHFIALTCHEDVEPWLQPDWVCRPAESLFSWRLLRRRPAIALDVVRCQASAWRLFAEHHYLSHAHNPRAVCFLASWQSRPVAFTSWLPLLGRGRPGRREHRTVTLPDYQGAGIGNALSAFIAGLWKALGLRAVSTTTHPALIASRRHSPLWRITREPSLALRGDRLLHATTRLTAGFEYVGPPQPVVLARLLLRDSPF
jgi:GNAT superfamily N-acetyltransferase